MTTKTALLDKIHSVCNNKKITQTLLTRWLKKWAEVRKVTVNLSHKSGGSEGRFYRFVSWPELEKDGENGYPENWDF